MTEEVKAAILVCATVALGEYGINAGPQIPAYRRIRERFPEAFEKPTSLSLYEVQLEHYRRATGMGLATALEDDPVMAHLKTLQKTTISRNRMGGM